MRGRLNVRLGRLEGQQAEALVLGAEINALLDVLDEEELAEVAEALVTGVWEAGSW